jgi:hypothetical protein
MTTYKFFMLPSNAPAHALDALADGWGAIQARQRESRCTGILYHKLRKTLRVSETLRVFNIDR